MLLSSIQERSCMAKLLKPMQIMARLPETMYIDQTFNITNLLAFWSREAFAKSANVPLLTVWSNNLGVGQPYVLL